MNNDKKRVILAYFFVTGINISGTLILPTITAYLMPFLFLLIPILLHKTINTRLDIRHITIGVVASALILIPAFIYKMLLGLAITQPPIDYILVTYLLVAFPEEVFFRGFLMESFGCNIKGVVISSLLFSMAHWYRYFLFGDYLAPLTFFPALIMGFLYMKTRNTITSTLFHGTCNTVLFTLG
ncbi:MAG: CPBP family intramembrane metalloprotease [Thermodesulfovibrionales bacterium]|nr:CPBP family intramembrane metalloprotease [Thermodesulfovibrionales bacterium]